MLWSLPFALISLLLISYTMHEANYGNDEASEEPKEAYRHMERVYFNCSVVLFTLSISIGLSNTVFSITSEILPNYSLSVGSALTQSFSWIVNFALNSFFLDALEDPMWKWVIFLFFAGMVVLCILFVAIFVPETVGKSTRQNLVDLVGKDTIHKQTKKLRKEYDIIDMEVKEPEVK